MKKEALITIAPGEAKVLDSTVAAGVLTISDGASISASEGRLVTLTSGGKELPVTPGTYHDAVLTVTEGFTSPLKSGPQMPQMPGMPAPSQKAALYVDKNGIVQSKSVLSALQGGSYDGQSMEGVTVQSDGDAFGVLVVDDCKFEVKDLTVTMNGTGGDDFNGKGCGIVVGKNSELTIDGYKLESHGLTRNALLAAGNSKVTMKNADITCYGVSDEEQVELSKEIRGMTSVPWVLGLSGNNRATNVLDSAEVTYIDSKIRAERWGALSTDGPSEPDSYWKHMLHLTAINCDIEVFGESGYGTYSIGSGYNKFHNCRFKVPDMAEVTANEIAASDWFDTTVDSKRFGVLWHQNQGGLCHLKNSTFNTGMTTFLVKGCYPEILVESSQLNAENGVILQLMESDDPGLGPKEVIVDTSVAQKVDSHDVTKVNYHDCYMYNQDAPNLCTDMRATFRDMSVCGDFYNSTVNAIRVGSYNPNPMPPMGMPGPDSDGPGGPGGPDDGPGDFVPPMMPSDPSSLHPINMALTFENAQVKGIISASQSKHNVSKISKENRIELGQVTNTPTPVVNNGVLVTLDGKSVWTVTGDCFLSSLSIAEGARVIGDSGKKVAITVDGAAVSAESGQYKGDIRISLAG